MSTAVASEPGPDELSYRVPRQVVGEGHEAGDLVGGEMLPAPGQQLLFGRLGPGRHDNEGFRYLVLAGRRDGRYGGVGDRRVTAKYAFHIAGVHHVPVGDEAIRDPADDPGVAVLVRACRISGPEPSALGQRGTCLLGLVPIAGHDVGATDQEFARLARPCVSAGGPDDLGVDEERRRASGADLAERTAGLQQQRDGRRF